LAGGTGRGRQHSADRGRPASGRCRIRAPPNALSGARPGPPAAGWTGSGFL